MVTLGPLSASLPDLLRLLSVPVFGWAAYRDVRTRRVRNRTWYPLLALAVVLLAWDAWAAWTHPGPFAATEWRAFALPAVVGVGVVVPLAYAFWRTGGFGGADAKALVVLALLFPVFPTYELAGTTLPGVRPPLETFSFTVLTNTVAFGIAYPLALAARNAVRGRVSPRMFVGHEVAVTELPERHGRLLDGPGGPTGGLDLDALRMYLRWRGTTLSALCERPDWHRDPASLPDDPNDPTDGAVTAEVPDPDGLPGAADGGDGIGLARADAAGEDPTARTDGDPDGSASRGAGADTTDQGVETDDPEGPVGDAKPDGVASPTPEADATAGGPDVTDGGDRAGAGPRGKSEGEDEDEGTGEVGEHGDRTVADPWGAEAFLADVRGTAYGTTPESLRAGLETVVARDAVLVSPGIPFVVPMFFGLVSALTVGDVLFWLLGTLGVGPA